MKKTIAILLLTYAFILPVQALKKLEPDKIWRANTSWNSCMYDRDLYPHGNVYSLEPRPEMNEKNYLGLCIDGISTDSLLRYDDHKLYLYTPKYKEEFVRYDYAGDWHIGGTFYVARPDWFYESLETWPISLDNGEIVADQYNEYEWTLFNNYDFLKDVGYVNNYPLLDYGGTDPRYLVTPNRTVQYILDPDGQCIFRNPRIKCVNMWMDKTISFEYNMCNTRSKNATHIRFCGSTHMGQYMDAGSAEWADKNAPVIPKSFGGYYATNDYTYAVPVAFISDDMKQYYDYSFYNLDELITVYDMTLEDGEFYNTVAFNGTFESPSYIPVVVVVRQAEPLVVNNVCWRRFHPEIHPISETGIDWNRTLPGPEYIVEGIGPTDRGLPGWLDCSEETADGPASGITITFNNLYFRDNDFVMGGANTIGGQMRTDRTWEYLLIDNDGQYNELFRMRFSKEEPKSDGAWDETAEMSVVSRLAFDDNGEESELREINPYVGYTYNMGRSGNEVFLLNEDEDRVLYRYPVQDGYVAPKGAFGLHVENGDTFIEQSFIWKANFWTRIDMMTCCGVTAEIAGDSGRNITYVQGIGVTDGGIYPRPTISSDSARPRIILNNVYDSEGNVVYAGAGIVPPVPNIVDTNPEDENNVVVFYNMQGQRVMSPRPGDLLIRQTSGKTEKIIF